MALFPSPEQADEDGLVLIGGRLNEQWLDDAYEHGIFPWPVDDEGLPRPVLCWFSPDPRAILKLDEFYVSRRLARRIRQGKFRVTFNQAFRDVISACALPRDDGGIWITAPLLEAYVQYAQKGKAISIEVWENNSLVGGLYGVPKGRYFSAESMFHRSRDASKVALWALVEILKRRGSEWIDVQVMTPHMASLGAVEISRNVFMEMMKSDTQQSPAVAWPTELSVGTS